jgi:HPt (histidine-containing phosphotransfer) domain-containing protein
MPSSESFGQPIHSVLREDPDMVELIELFVGDMPSRIEALCDALDQADHQMLMHLAHQLKGAGGGYGYPQITDAARIVEQATREEDVPVELLCRCVHDLVELCRRACA